MRRALLLCLVFTSGLVFCQEPSRALEYYALVQKFSQAIGEGRWEEAADAGSKALEISQVDGDLWMQYGNALSRLNKHEQAITAFKKSLELGAFANKHRAVASFSIASASAKLGNKDDALKWLNEAFNAGHRDIRVFRNTEFELLKGYGNYDDLAANKDVSGLSRNDGLAYDLWFLDRELRRIHFDPYMATNKATLDREFAAIQAAIPSLTDDEFYVRCRRYVAMVGDGHTALRMGDWTSPDTRQLPVRFIKLTDGVFVNGATDQFKSLVGARLVSISGTSVDAAWSKMAELVSRDNIYDDAAQVPAMLGFASLLKGTGLVGGDAVKLSLRQKDGTTSMVELPLAPPAQVAMVWQSFNPVPLYLRNTEKPYWFTYIEEERTVYLQYNSVRNDPTEPMTAFMDRVFKETEGKPVEKFVIDVRFNGGGNSFLNSAIQRPVMRNPAINTRGKLFIITGRNTFSAAQNFTTDFMRESEAIFVGEPTGSRPNFVGETNPVVLPFTKMRMTVSDLYWQRSWPMDHRMWIPPDIPTETSWALYFAGRDPALEAVFAFGK